MKHSIKYYLVFALLFSLKSFSQDVPKGFELMEIVKIAETYRLAPDLSFDMQFTYSDSVQPNTILEQLQGSYKIHDGKYWASIDSNEFIQGNQYSLGIFYNDSIIAVNNRQDYSNVMQIPMMDSLFREAHVAQMEVTKLNDSTRSLKIEFNSDGPYRGYEIQYDLNSFLIRKVKYYMSEAVGEDNPGSSGVVCITIGFSNYSGQVIDEDYFNETKFIYRQGDQFLTQPAFAGFRLMVSGSNQAQ